MERIFEVINNDTTCVLGAQKNTLNEGHIFAVQGRFVHGF